jgi:hypothetical protein
MKDQQSLYLTIGELPYILSCSAPSHGSHSYTVHHLLFFGLLQSLLYSHPIFTSCNSADLGRKHASVQGMI